MPGRGAGTYTDAMRAPVGKVACITFATMFRVAFFIVHARLTAALNTEQVPAVLIVFAGQTSPHSTCPYRATTASITESIAAFAVFCAFCIGHILRPFLAGAGVRDGPGCTPANEASAEDEATGALGSLLAGESTRPPGASSMAEQEKRPNNKNNAPTALGVDIEIALLWMATRV